MSIPTQSDYKKWAQVYQRTYGENAPMTYEEFADVWGKSGNWDEHGINFGQYKLGRIDPLFSMTRDNAAIYQVGYEAIPRKPYETKARKMEAAGLKPIGPITKKKSRNYKLIDLRVHVAKLKARKENEQRTDNDVGDT
jgi:hypothetical protein